MLANRDRLGHRSYRSHQRAGLAFGDERQRGLDFSVLWKVFSVGQIKSAACRIQTELTLLVALQRTRDSMNVAQIKSSRINQRAIAFFRRNFKSPNDGFRESVLNRAALVSIVTVRAKRFVRSNQRSEEHTSELQSREKLV